MVEDRLLKLALVASGGAIGSVARYMLSVWAQGAWNRGAAVNYPLGTALVNLLGSVAFGLVWTWSAQSANSAEWRLFMLAGMMGAFTTFSTLMFESVEAAQQGRLLMALLHLTVHLVLGAAAIVLGSSLGRLLLPQ